MKIDEDSKDQEQNANGDVHNYENKLLYAEGYRSL